MKTLLVIVVVVIAVLVVLAAIAKKKTKESPTAGGNDFAYKAKAVMSGPEQVLYFRMVEALPDKLVLAQVQMSSFLGIDGRQPNWRALSSRTREKSADFLICEKDASVLAVVELQDSTHERPERAKSDDFKRKATEAAGLRLVEFHVKNMPNVEEIRNTVLPKT